MHILKWDFWIYENNSVFNFLRTIPTIFYSGCTVLCFYQQHPRIPLSPYPCIHFYFLLHYFILCCFFFYNNLPNKLRQYFIVVLICISLMMLNIFSCIHRSFVCLFLKYLYSSILPILKFCGFFFSDVELYKFLSHFGY